MRKLLLLPFLLLGCPVFGEVDFNGKMPEDLIPELRDIIAAALESSETVGDLDLREAEARGRRTAYKSVTLPSFNARVSLRQERDDDAESDASFEERLVYNITLSQPIYHWGSLKSEKQIGDIQYEMQQVNADKSIENLVASIRKEYLSLIIAKQRFILNQMIWEQAKSKLEFHEQQVAAGAASEVSLLPYQISVDREEIDMLRGQANYERELAGLAQLVSIDLLQLEEMVTETVPDFEVLARDDLSSIESLFPYAVERNEDMKLLLLDIEMEKRRLLIEDNALRPKLNAEVGLSSNALDVDGTRREQAYSFYGVSLNWRIFDGFRKKGRTLEVLSRLAAKERDRTSLESKLLTSYQSALRKLEIEQRALTIEERLLSSGERRRDWILENVEAGRMSSSEAEASERELLSSQINNQSARVRYLSALVDLAKVLNFDPRFAMEPVE